MKFLVNGVELTTTNDALALAQAIFTATFGSNVNLDPTSPNGQTIQQIANAITTGDANLEFLLNSINPNLAQGVCLDAICSNLYLYRQPASYSTATCQVSGLNGTTISVGSQIQSTNGDKFALVGSPIVIANGVGSGTFQALVAGSNVPVASGTLVNIITSISGWDTVNNSQSGTVGSDVESDFNFRNRFNFAKATAGTASFLSTQSKLFGIVGIGPFVLIENDTTAAITQFGVTIQPNTLYLIVNKLGTDSVYGPAIAQAMFNGKSAGGGTQGTQTYNYPIPNTNPVQTRTIKWDIPTAVSFVIKIIFQNPKADPSVTLTFAQYVTNLFNDNWSYTGLAATVFAATFINILENNALTDVASLQLSTDGGTTFVNYFTLNANQIIVTPLTTANLNISFLNNG
jgi:hypothetical protein